VLGALGVVAKQQAEVKEQNTAIKENTNGTHKELLGIISQQHSDLVTMSHRLADMQPPPKKDGQ
jgi:phosphoribosylformylglycinamidine (FGAM) synthase-like amidotransferase family enzyme